MTALGFVGHRMATEVMIPNVPSEPIKSCFKSRPVLSLRKVWRQSNTCPSAMTTSNPENVIRITIGTKLIVTEDGDGKNLEIGVSSKFDDRCRLKNNNNNNNNNNRYELKIVTTDFGLSSCINFPSVHGYNMIR